MIVIDSSALIAILEAEPDAKSFADAIGKAHGPIVSAAALIETNIVMMRRHGPNAARKVASLVRESDLQVEAVLPRHVQTAIDAFAIYGKGMGHSAGLNFGDCFSYALAKETGLPLLFKGLDFSRTDIPSAL